MILDEITLHNFGLYAQRQTITLTPPTADKPVILFGGLNGGGKTTLLDALQLCLFGPHARISNRGSLSYSEYLARCIHRDAHPSEAAIELSFRHTLEGCEAEYKLHRFWRKVNDSCKEHFVVLKNGQPEPVLADNWASQVGDFLPANIAHLFLFDGEQIERYASESDSSALIGAAIQSLLGLDVVDQLEKDLQTYERRKRTEGKDASSQEQISVYKRELEDLYKRSHTLGQERASLLTHQIDSKRYLLIAAEERFRNLGGGLFEERAQIEGRLGDATKAIETGAEGLREMAAGALPLQRVRDLLEAVSIRDKSEDKSRRARDVFEILESRDQVLLKYLRSRSDDKDLINALCKFLEADRAKRGSSSSQETSLNLSPEARGDLHALLNGSLDELTKAATQQLQRQQWTEAEAERLRLEHQSIPESHTIAEVLAERDALKQEIAMLEGRYAQIGEELERVKRDVQRKEGVLTQLLEVEVTAEGEREDRTRILRHAEKVRGTLGAFRRAVIRRHVGRIEQLVLQSYQQLLRKASLVTHLSIDPERFALTLYGRNGHILSPERLSAGERQLLAIALLWGLAKASGRPLPTAIDTPLGRLDSSHRTHLVERYLPFASHQVLLFSTDEEITGEYLERLRPWIGRMYQLDYDDSAGETRVMPGYFKAKQAA
jgi:DNA sulfur modification protein DndD